MSDYSHRLYVNVGLKSSPHLGPVHDICPQFVVDTLRQLGFSVYSANVANSTTEPTLVAAMLPPSPYTSLAELFRLAELCRQDCVAAYYPFLEDGALIGPRAESWGEFNREYFLFPASVSAPSVL